MSGYITFTMNERELACRLDEVREVVRAVGIDALPGTRAPVSGVLELRGDPLPVIDLRSTAYPGETGDVLVLNSGVGGSYGVAVDQVLAVLSGDELLPDDNERPAGLPPYVLEVLRDPQDRSPVMLVNLRVLAGLDV
ncbi:MAG: chemotaxis protein CheW [Actinomycetes bacterium]